MNYTGNVLRGVQHAYMRDYLQTMYNINATILALGGLEKYPWFSSLLHSRNISSNEYWQKKQEFKDKTSGTPCN